MEEQPRAKRRSAFSVGHLFAFNYDSENKNDKAFTLAMFNGLAIILVIISLLMVCCVYLILQPFIKPLVWALLVGSALHPIKEAVSNNLRTVFDQLETSSAPIYLNVFCIPLSTALTLCDSLGNFLVKHIYILVQFIGTVCALVGIYLYTPLFVWKSCSIFFAVNTELLSIMLDVFSSTVVVTTVFIGFFIALTFLWGPKKEVFFSISSVIVWLAGTAWVANIVFGYLRLPIFLAFQLSLGCATIYPFISAPARISEENPPEGPSTVEEVSDSADASITTDGALNSWYYIRWLSLICSCIFLISIPSVPYIFVIMVATYGLKQACYYFGIVDIFKSHVETTAVVVNEWFVERQRILMPPPLKYFLSLLGTGRNLFLGSLKGCCDSASAVLVILGLTFFGMFISVFFTVQVYKESVYLVQAGGSIINKTIVHNPELQQMMPEDWQSTMDTALNNAYIYAREGLSKLIRSFLKGKDIDESKTEELEKGALELWDRAYQAWVMPIQPKIGPKVTPDAVISSCYEFLEGLKKTPEVMSLDYVQEFVKDNMSTLSAGLDSLWIIVRGNMSLLLGILTTLFSLLFGGGLSVINFMLHSVVFLTALFYLLSSSREMYKPVEMMTHMSPQYGKKLALAVELSCREVLAASVKLSVFYGLWTWLVHTVFLSNLVYMPAVFAAILGVVPVLGTYWACLPALLDLWLMQDSKIRAFGLFLAQISPTAIVETTVYNEIKGSGHPYLTGLSIAGGLFWLGMEGAIAGPLLLCFLFTIIKVLSSFDVSSAS